MRRTCGGQDSRPVQVPDSGSKFLSYDLSYGDPPQPAASKQAGVPEESYDNLGQTGFQPTLYLKCGPLLLFTGIYRQQRVGESYSVGMDDTDIWGGSIMIATLDTQSSYTTPRQRSSTFINVYQRLSTTINDHQRSLTTINVYQRPVTFINDHQRSSMTINIHRRPSTLINARSAHPRRTQILTVLFDPRPDGRYILLRRED